MKASGMASYAATTARAISDNEAKDLMQAAMESAYSGNRVTQKLARAGALLQLAIERAIEGHP